ncbi:hypothetical protein DMX02_02670 [Pseudomonas jessenii]|nr:hypothetical protein DMX02_02670 [Pseudomonas jessenii]
MCVAGGVCRCRGCDLRLLLVLRLNKYPNCRSEPARDSGLSVAIIGDCQSAIASRLTPTGDLW